MKTSGTIFRGQRSAGLFATCRTYCIHSCLLLIVGISVTFAQDVRTGLMDAVLLREPIESIRDLLVEGGEMQNINVVDHELHVSPLQWALERGLMDVADLLFENGADPHLGHETRGTTTPLHVALSQDCVHPLILKVIGTINSTEKANAVNDHYVNYFHLAFEKKCSEAVIAGLLEKGTDTSYRNNAGQTAIHLAVRAQVSPELLLNLLEHSRADVVNVKDYMVQNPLYVSLSYPNRELTGILLDFGSDVDCVKPYHGSARDVARKMLEKKENREDPTLLRVLSNGHYAMKNPYKAWSTSEGGDGQT